MMLANRSGFRGLTGCRFIISVFLILLIIYQATAGIRRVQISKQLHSSPVEAASYFRVHGAYGGGVVPRGTAEFLSPAKARLSAGQLQLVILNKTKLANNRADYDAIGIRWQDKVYQLTTQDDLLYPLMKFIQRGSYIAFTIPVAKFNKKYFEQNGLLPYRNAFVAKEFQIDSHKEFLAYTDVDTKTEAIPVNLKVNIVKEANKSIVAFASPGTYVNADFHVKYQVFLDLVKGKSVADVGGLPLRYHWYIGKNGSSIVHNVEVFKFPEKELSLQYRAVLFFQTAAILRQFKRDNPREFDRFLIEVGRVIGKL